MPGAFMSELEQRIAVLETNQRHAEAKLDKMSEKVDEMHALLLQAKGARWFILGVAALGGAIASKVTVLTAFFAGKM